MIDQAPATDLERRKMVRLRLRSDLSILPQRYEGRTYYVIKDPVSLRYYRFKEQEQFIVQMMNGVYTLDETQKAYEKRFRPERLTLEDLEQFGQQLLNAGLVQNESPQAGKLLYERRYKRLKSEWIQTLTNILYIRVPVFDPDRLLTRMVPYFRWVFTVWFLLLSIGVVLGAVFLVLSHFETFYNRLPYYQQFFSLKNMLYMWAGLGIVKVIHEFGHGLSCKALGGECHEMGFLFLCFSPAMYCNVSDAWTMPNKWHRIIIGGAGIYVELMIAAIATFIWWNTPGEPVINNLCLTLMIICSVSTVLFNGNPLMKFDGYYVLADWLEIPNLRDRSTKYIQRLLMEHCLGIESQPEPYMELRRRILFVTYAVISYLYRWFITFAIIRTMSMLLKPYNLEVISNMLAVAAMGSMFGWPLYRIGQNIYKRGRLPDMKTPRVVSTAVLVAALLGLFFFLPVPVSRIRQGGIVQVQPGYAVPVHVQVSGILQKIYVKEGERVRQGQTLAEFSNLDLDKAQANSKAVIQSKDRLRQTYEIQFNESRDPKERVKLEQLMRTTQAERDAAAKSLRQIDSQLKLLVLIAPMDGRVVNPPKVDERGMYWDKDQAPLFCNVGNAGHLRVLVPVNTADYDLLQENWTKLQNGKQLPVTIRVQGRAGATWPGFVADLPKSEAREIPLGLATKGGGPLATKPGADPKQLVPQNQVYLVGVNFLEVDDAITPGSLAQVKIHCEYRSCAWWTWRALSQAFDLGLL